MKGKEREGDEGRGERGRLRDRGREIDDERGKRHRLKERGRGR